LGFSIYWLIQKSKWFFVCIATLLLGWQQISVMVSFSSNKKLNLAKTPETLRVLTWNLSSWGESNKAFKKNNMNVMIPLIKNINADVLCFQEYLYFKNSTYRDSIIPALKEKGYLYSYFAQTNYTARMYKTAVLTAVVIISKYPIIDTAQFEYNKGDFAEPTIYADIKINEKTVRIFTTHLQSVQFEYNDYDALSKLKEPYKASVQQSRATAGKLKYAYKRRALQADILHKKITESPYPVIVCGDFNDVPNSYTYFTIKGNLQDAFLKKGSGFGRTFRFISPTLRIDYILADKKFEVKQYKKFEANYSDHYPVMADIKLK
jgi:endonuclease/exonuclease/phosphatase family metal-dependent hydrolase